MDENDIRLIETLKNLPVLDEDAAVVRSVATAEKVLSIAEASDMVRLHELLHRDEYRPLFAICGSRDPARRIRVYFERIHETE